MISEKDTLTFFELCDDAVEEPAFGRVVSRLVYIAEAQTDARLEFLLRGFIDQEGEAAVTACEELADYTEYVMEKIRIRVPSFDSDDMQLVLSGVRARIEAEENE